MDIHQITLAQLSPEHRALADTEIRMQRYGNVTDNTPVSQSFLWMDSIEGHKFWRNLLEEYL